MTEDQKIFLLQRQVSALRKELVETKELVQNRKIKTNNFLLLGGFFSLMVLLGLNAQSDRVQFHGDRLQPLVEEFLELLVTGSVAGMATNYFLEEKES